MKLVASLAVMLLVIASSCPAQTNPSKAKTEQQPFTSTLSELRHDPSQLRRIEAGIKNRALQDLMKLGALPAERAHRLMALSPSRFMESLAVTPAVGPSTIAAPRSGTSVPQPSINWVGDKGGATTGDPGVALLLARREGTDAFSVYCTGTLIRQNLILTAAHCICYSPEAMANYADGSFCERGNASTTPAPLLQADRWLVFFQHAGVRTVKSVEIDDAYQFSSAAVRNDLAVLVLSTAVTEIDPVTMPPASDSASAWASGDIVGFGYSANPNSPSATILEQLVLPGIKAQGQVSDSPCTAESYLDPIGALCSMYSVSGAASQSTVCGGDSGGPLWQTGNVNPEIGVTSGRTDDNCAAPGTMGFEMSTAYRTHWSWIQARVAQVGSATVQGQWPTFGENLRHVLDRRNATFFDDRGNYVSDGWLLGQGQDVVLATMNSSGEILHFTLQDRAGHTLCTGVAGTARQVPNVDLCWASIPSGVQFHIVAKGTPNEYLQYVVTVHAKGGSFYQ